MQSKNYLNYIVDVVDFPKAGIVFKDITPLLEEPSALREALSDFRKQISTLGDFDKIACCDARGFLFGVSLAQDFDVPCVLARKKGKLPRPGVSVSYALEYGENTLEISLGSVKPGDRFVIVDDLLATGGSVNAVKQMIEKCGGTVTGVATLIELEALKGRDALGNTKVVSCVRY